VRDPLPGTGRKSARAAPPCRQSTAMRTRRLAIFPRDCPEPPARRSPGLTSAHLALLALPHLASCSKQGFEGHFVFRAWSRAPPLRRFARAEPRRSPCRKGSSRENLLNFPFHGRGRHLLRQRELLDEQTPGLIEQAALTEGEILVELQTIH